MSGEADREREKHGAPHFIAPRPLDIWQKSLCHYAQLPEILFVNGLLPVLSLVLAQVEVAEQSFGSVLLSALRLCCHRSSGNLIIRELRKRKRYIALASSDVELLLCSATLNNETGLPGIPTVPARDYLSNDKVQS